MVNNNVKKWLSTASYDETAVGAFVQRDVVFAHDRRSEAERMQSRRLIDMAENTTDALDMIKKHLGGRDLSVTEWATTTVTHVLTDTQTVSSVLLHSDKEEDA